MIENSLKELRADIEEKKKEYANSIVVQYNRIVSLIEESKRQIAKGEELLEELDEEYKKTSGHSIRDINKELTAAQQELHPIGFVHEEGVTQRYLMPNWRKEKISWTGFIFEYIKRVDRLVSFSEFMDITSPVTREEATTLTRSISSALSTGYKNKRLRRASIGGQKGYYYGLPDFFEDGVPKSKYSIELQRRLNLPEHTIIEVEVDPEYEQINVFQLLEQEKGTQNEGASKDTVTEEHLRD
ncbi:hypothetical protein IQ277_35705 [Nostocales cyanobacterium LEGE 12452]|nr:hypothetical protein [Nostocales cyanobacterium LEGE 12452]